MTQSPWLAHYPKDVPAELSKVPFVHLGELVKKASTAIALETGIPNGPLAIAVIVAVYIDSPDLDKILLVPALYSLFIVIISTIVTFWFRRANLAAEQKIPNLL